MSEENKGNQMRSNCENKEKCFEMIQAVLDGSASDEEMKHFENSIDECLPCLENYQLEKSIKETLKAKLEKKCCPEKTVNSIKASLGISLLAVVFLLAEIKLIQEIF